MPLILSLALSGLLSGLSPSLGIGQQTAREINAVRGALNDYRSAILSTRGEAAADLVSAATLTYYGRMRELALFGDSASVRRESFTDRLMVLVIRHRVPAESLLDMTSRELFVYAVEAGMIGRESVQRLEFGRVRMAGDSAGVEIEQAGTPSGTFFPVVREQGDWRVDLARMSELVDAALVAVAKQQRMSEDALLLFLIGGPSGGAVRPTIWRPLYDRHPHG